MSDDNGEAYVVQDEEEDDDDMKQFENWCKEKAEKAGEECPDLFSDILSNIRQSVTTATTAAADADAGGGGSAGTRLFHDRRRHAWSQRQNLGNFMNTVGLHVGNPWPKYDRNEQRNSTFHHKQQQRRRPKLSPLGAGEQRSFFNYPPLPPMIRSGVSNRAIKMQERGRDNLYGRLINKPSDKKKDEERSKAIYKLFEDAKRTEKQGGGKKTKRKRRRKKRTRRKRKRKKKTRKRIKRKKRTRK